ncbi:unnamed protein product, partial [Mesorhabditis belari]|uniref:Lipid-binding serum glycoprotein C-terminal domain-containing protein n=1 Tax=Mesorhabditis belari TaxID=2138241 RepID=A0AAF3EAY0_9BILA
MKWSLILPLLFTITFLIAPIETQSIANSFFAETGTNAGFYSRVNQKGLDLLSDYLKDRVNRFMAAGDLNFNISSSISPEIKVALLSQRVLSFDETQFRSKLESQPGKGLQWTGKSLNISVSTMFTIETNAGELIGTAPLLIENANIDFLLWTGVNADGHLKTDLVTCKVSGGSGTLQLAASDIGQLGEEWPQVQEYLNANLDQIICPSFHSELVPVVSNRLMNTPLSASLFDQFFINYGLLGPVQFDSDKILLKHRGNTFGILRQGRTRLNDFRLPFRAGNLEVEAESGRMVDFLISNYTLGSLLFWMDQYRKFDYEISKTAQNNSALAGYLRTDCGKDDICAGTIFPALKEKFAAGSVRSFMWTTRSTHMYSNPIEPVAFLTANMAVEVKYDEPKFLDYVFKAKLRIDKFKLTDVSSTVEGIDANSLEFLVNALIELVLNDEMGEKMK